LSFFLLIANSDLDEAIGPLTSLQQPRHHVLTALAELGQAADLEKSIVNKQEAINLTLKDKPDLPDRLSNSEIPWHHALTTLATLWTSSKRLVKPSTPLRI
jgi:hypothetical protein